MDNNEVREIRKRLGLNPVQFGEKIGVSGSMVEAIETGRRNIAPGVAAKILALRGKHE